MMAKTLNEDFPPLEAVARKPEAKPEKMALWKAAFVTDPTAVKPITGKQYKGNSPKPYWIIQRATEVFGACGIGWGLEVINERFERLTDTDVLHVALIRVWYEYEGKRGAVEQMGQTKACYKTNSGTMMVDEDAPKKSVTDGMVKCLSMLGFAGDIFSGRWDDSKYVAEAAAETKRRTDAENPPEPVKTITEAQVAELDALITQVGADKAAFLKFGKLEKLADMKPSDYPKAVAALNKKREVAA